MSPRVTEESLRSVMSDGEIPACRASARLTSAALAGVGEGLEVDRVVEAPHEQPDQRQDDQEPRDREPQLPPRDDPEVGPPVAPEGADGVAEPHFDAPETTGT